MLSKTRWISSDLRGKESQIYPWLMPQTPRLNVPHTFEDNKHLRQGGVTADCFSKLEWKNRNPAQKHNRKQGHRRQKRKCFQHLNNSHQSIWKLLITTKNHGKAHTQEKRTRAVNIPQSFHFSGRLVGSKNNPWLRNQRRGCKAFQVTAGKQRHRFVPNRGCITEAQT